MPDPRLSDDMLACLLALAFFAGATTGGAATCLIYWHKRVVKLKAELQRLHKLADSEGWIGPR